MICWTVSTYNRPHLLPRIIAAFERQTMTDRAMLILDDGGQLPNCSGDDGRWHIVSYNRRAPSLGAKRNSCVEIAEEYFPRMTAFCPVDDDDIPLAWHTEAAAAALERADWSRPSQVLSPATTDPWTFRANYTGHRVDPAYERMYHPCWAISLAAFRAVGGYPEDYSGPEDKQLMLRMEAAGISQADPIELGYRPSYVYCWHPKESISSRLSREDPKGQQAWASLGRTLEPAKLERWEPPFDLANPVILEGVAPRPF